MNKKYEGIINSIWQIILTIIGAYGIMRILTSVVLLNVSETGIVIVVIISSIAVKISSILSKKNKK